MGEPPAPALPEAGVGELDALLATKLHVPRTRRGLVARPRLVERLTLGLQGELTVVCAPAGFGKTALLADWARHGGEPVAWLSLDAGDNDPSRFWRHAAAALGSVRDVVGQRLGPLHGPRLIRAEFLLAVLLLGALAALDAVGLLRRPGTHGTGRALAVVLLAFFLGGAANYLALLWLARGPVVAVAPAGRSELRSITWRMAGLILVPGAAALVAWRQRAATPPGSPPSSPAG